MRYFLLYTSLSIVFICTIILLRNNWATLTDFKMSCNPPFFVVEKEVQQFRCGVRDEFKGEKIYVSTHSKALFLEKCACCHNPNMKMRSTGPALAGVEQRWTGREKLLYRYIRDAQKVRKTGDAYANALYLEYGKIPHTVFPQLTNNEIDEILKYIRSRS